LPAGPEKFTIFSFLISMDLICFFVSAQSGLQPVERLVRSHPTLPSRGTFAHRNVLASSWPSLFHQDFILLSTKRKSFVSCRRASD
jgi:hypothetical protein